MNKKIVSQERQKKKSLKLKLKGAALILLGELEIVFSSLTPLIEITAIALGCYTFYKSWKLMHYN